MSDNVINTTSFINTDSGVKISIKKNFRFFIVIAIVFAIGAGTGVYYAFIKKIAPIIQKCDVCNACAPLLDKLNISKQFDTKIQIKDKIDSTKTQISDKINNAKSQIGDLKQSQMGSIRSKISNKIGSTKSQISEEKDELLNDNNFFESGKQQINNMLFR